MNIHLRNLLVIAFVLCSCQLSYAQNAISGYVKDQQTNLPLEDAIVRIESQNLHIHTDAEGYFTFSNVVAGTHTISVSKLGYDSRKTEFILEENERKEAFIPLVYHPVSLTSVDIAADRPVSAASSKFIGNRDFNTRPKNSAQDLLKVVPGLFIAQHAGGGKAEQIFIRGFDCDHGTDVATYVDGIPVNMPSHGHGQGYSDLHFLIPETVEGMEIFKGPTSPKYGNFATGAAVEFKTVDSLENNLIQSETVYVPNSNAITATRQLALLRMPNLGNKITSYLAAEVVNNRSYFESSQHFKRINIFSKTTVAVTDHSHVHFSLSGFNSSWDASGQIPERAVKSNMITRFGGIDNTEGGTTGRNNLNLVYHTQIAATEFETQIYLSDYRFKLFSNFTLFLNDSINGDQIEQDDNRSIKGFNSHYTFGHKFGKLNNKFTIGMSYRSDNIENQLWNSQERQRADVISHSRILENSASIYMNEVFRFSEKFRAEVGGRLDYFIFDVSDLIPADTNRVNNSGYNYQTLVSPKVNLIYTLNDRTQFFVNLGSGFHSNDARSVVQEPGNHLLPRAPGAEVGTLIHPTNNLTVSFALWTLHLENELAYIGDEGTTENKGKSRRTGIDLSLRYQFTPWLYSDIDINLSRSRFVNENSELQVSELYIPLAPAFTSTGGLTAKLKNGFETSVRYRMLADRPANETGSVTAYGYTLIDFSALYKMKNYRFGFSIENVTNAEWNEAQFDTESRLQNEAFSTSEIHFTPGTPVAFKVMVGYSF